MLVLRRAAELVQFLTMSSAAFFTPFHPFADFSRLGRGHVLRARVDCDTFAANYYDPRGTIDQFFPIPAAPHLKLFVWRSRIRVP
jgi:hypothetical protein